MLAQFRKKIMEALTSILPITAIVLILSITLVPLSAGVIVLFEFGAIFLLFGMSLFTFGVDMSMIPMGEGIGMQVSKTKGYLIPVLVCFVMGTIITIAEPDLQVLANQITSVPNMTLILAVAIGVGIFLVIALLRIIFKIRLSYLLFIFYALVFLLAYFCPDEFIPAAFDSGGVTTGPITVPFIMAFGIGLSALRSDKDASDDSFGLIALCSIGPILAVLILALFTNPEATTQAFYITEIETTRDAIRAFAHELPHYAREILIAVLPIAAIFVVYQLISKRFRLSRLIRIGLGFIYTYLGLVLFLTGVNVGFLPVGRLLGERLATGSVRYLLIPVGMLVGYFIVAAEPAVHVLKAQVEEISNGLISKSAIGTSLSIGVALSVGIAMCRILFDIPIMYFLIPGYLIALIISLFVPPIYTGVAFDSGGVASGPMTATFLLPLAIGASEAAGVSVLKDAFGIVAMVAMTPLITIQLLGLFAELKRKSRRRKIRIRLEQLEDTMHYYEDE